MRFSYILAMLSLSFPSLATSDDLSASLEALTFTSATGTPRKPSAAPAFVSIITAADIEEMSAHCGLSGSNLRRAR